LWWCSAIGAAPEAGAPLTVSRGDLEMAAMADVLAFVLELRYETGTSGEPSFRNVPERR